MDQQPRCDDCPFYVELTEAVEDDPTPEGDSVGECRRFPPKIVSHLGGGRTTVEFRFPETSGSLWCGEHPAFLDDEEDDEDDEDL